MDHTIAVTGIPSILILSILLYGTVFETRTPDRRRSSLALVIACALVQTVNYSLIPIILASGRPGLLLWMVAVEVPGSMVAALLFARFILHVMKSLGVTTARYFRCLNVYTATCTALLVALMFAGQILRISDSAMTPLWGFYLFILLYSAEYILVSIVILRNQKKLGKRNTFILLGFILMPVLRKAVFGILIPSPDLTTSYVALTLTLVYVMLQSQLRADSEQEKLDYFKSMSEIYYTLHVLDLEKRSFFEYGADRIIHNYIGEHADLDLQNLFWGIMSRRICDAHSEVIREFTNLSTLEQRMRGTNMIDIDVINVDNRWFRFSFIRIGREEEGLKRVFFTSMDIDDSKRKEHDLVLMSLTDELTRLNNRNAYEDSLKELAETGLPEDLIYLICDLNGLKAVNDTFGHSEGDELLIHAAGCLSKAFSPGGKVFRTGGDEFVVLFRGSREDFGLMLDALESMRSGWRGKTGYGISFSIGAAESSEIADGDLKHLIQLADQRMYEAKRRYYQAKDADRRNRAED